MNKALWWSVVVTVVLVFGSSEGAEPVDNHDEAQQVTVVFEPGEGKVSPAATVFVSAVFPGWGQLATNNSWRAALAFGFESWFLARLMMYDRKALRYRDRFAHLEGDDRTNPRKIEVEYWELKRDNAWWAGGALFIIALDAYVGAHLDGFGQDKVSVPDDWDPGDIPMPIELPPAADGGTPILSWSMGF
jgi:hypothetical protein